MSFIGSKRRRSRLAPSSGVGRSRGRLASRPSWTIKYIADQLRLQRHRLEELSHADQNVRASFEISYSARALCLLGLWPARDIGLAASASPFGESENQAERVLEYLVDMYLVESPLPGRYRLHDLLHNFAAERAEKDLEAADRYAAITRLVTWYTQTAASMHAVLAPASP